MVGDKEMHNNVGERKTVESHTQESSPEVVPECVGRKCTIIPSGGKRQVQLLISDVAKKMWMSSNLAKRKREEDDTSSFVFFNQYGRGEITTFSKVPVSTVKHGQTGAGEYQDQCG